MVLIHKFWIFTQKVLRLEVREIEEHIHNFRFKSVVQWRILYSPHHNIPHLNRRFNIYLLQSLMTFKHLMDNLPHFTLKSLIFALKLVKVLNKCVEVLDCDFWPMLFECFHDKLPSFREYLVADTVPIEIGRIWEGRLRVECSHTLDNHLLGTGWQWFFGLVWWCLEEGLEDVEDVGALDVCMFWKLGRLP